MPYPDIKDKPSDWKTPYDLHTEYGGSTRIWKDRVDRFRKTRTRNMIYDQKFSGEDARALMETQYVRTFKIPRLGTVMAISPEAEQQLLAEVKREEEVKTAKNRPNQGHKKRIKKEKKPRYEWRGSKWREEDLSTAIAAEVAAQSFQAREESPEFANAERDSQHEAIAARVHHHDGVAESLMSQGWKTPFMMLKSNPIIWETRMHELRAYLIEDLMKSSGISETQANETIGETMVGKHRNQHGNLVLIASPAAQKMLQEWKKWRHRIPKADDCSKEPFSR